MLSIGGASTGADSAAGVKRVTRSGSTHAAPLAAAGRQMLGTALRSACSAVGSLVWCLCLDLALLMLALLPLSAHVAD